MTTDFDSYGMPATAYDTGDTAVTGDETCTRTWYARNDSLGINSLASRTRAVGRTCSTAETDLSLPTSTNTRGDALSDAATVHDSTTATHGHQGERYPASWQTVDKTTYDTLGRPLEVTDALGNPTTTVCTPTNAALLCLPAAAASRT